MSDQRLTLIRASAGAGKTYRLTGRYIALLAAGAEPSSILATTFTRKAAGEILGRVLLRVAAASIDAEACRELNAAVAAEQIATVQTLTQSDFRGLLTRLVRGLDQLAISTIDGFFSRCVTAFSLELGVPSQPQLTDDGSAMARDLRGQAIDALLDHAAGDDFETLLALLRQIHFDGARQSVAGSLDRVLSGGVEGLYDVYRQAPAEAQWPALPCPKPLSTEHLTACLNELRDAEGLLPKTGKGTVNKTWLKGYLQSIEALESGQWDLFLSRGPALKAVQRIPFSRAEADEALCELYEPLVTHAIGSMVTQLNHQTKSTYQLLDRFAGRFNSVCGDQQVLFYADLTDLLVRKLPKIDAASGGELAFRLDSHVQHLLIDEFQDTSIDQYRVLWPFIDEVSADETTGRTFFCVGDAKQSIYGWRGGRVELFDQIEAELGPRRLKVDSIAQSYRSSQVILDAANDVFGSMDHTAAWADDDVARDRFAGLYETHTAARDLPGYVCFETTTSATVDAEFEEEEAQDARGAQEPNPHEAAVAQRVADLYRSAPGKSIALLTRSNAQASTLLSALRRRGVPASGEGGAVLTDHPAVTAVLAAFTLADHPGDRVAAFHVFSSPVNKVVKMATAGLADAAKASASLRRWILDDGVAGLLARIIQTVEADADEAGARRLRQLLLFAETQQTPSLLRPSRFVQAVQSARVPDPEAAPVTVMTIHKSKGLEFDAVFLPTLAGRTRNFTPLYLEERDGDTGPIQAVYRGGDKSVRSVCERLEKLYDAAKQRSRFEDLCTLYVAMTRAIHALYLLAPPATGKDGSYPKGSYAESITETLGVDGATEEATQLYESGDRDWFVGSEKNETTNSPPPLREGLGEGESGTGDSGSRGRTDSHTPAPNPSLKGGGLPTLTWSLTRGQGRLPRAINPSAPDRAKLVEAASLLRPGAPGTSVTPGSSAGIGVSRNTGDAIQSGAAFGDAVHAAFERIGFVDVPGFDLDEALADAPDQVAGVIRQALKAPEIHDAISRRDAAGLKQEHGFTYRHGQAIVRGQIDRLVWWEDDTGRVTKAQIIDFKTDSPPEGEDSGAFLVDRYRGQMLAYRKAVAGLFDISIERVSSTLLWVTQGQCLEV